MKAKPECIICLFQPPPVCAFRHQRLRMRAQKIHHDSSLIFGFQSRPNGTALATHRVGNRSHGVRIFPPPKKSIFGNNC